MRFQLSISNIGWEAEEDRQVYGLMKQYGFQGLEIAPTRIFSEKPYDRLSEAAAWSEGIRREYGFGIPSMQSIWFGRQEKLFGSEQERDVLAAYTRKAIDFAAATGCGNLVFGCPKNRAMPEGADPQVGIDFFRAIGEYAAGRGTVVGLEANPPIYGTNYINDTVAALRLVEEVASEGFWLNLDLGAMIHNGEGIHILEGKVQLISHVHISEPGLKVIENRQIHRELRDVLLAGGYGGFVSIEMGKTGSLAETEAAMEYVKEVFGG